MEIAQYKKRIIVTGGAGFIGSNLLNHMVNKYPDYLFVNVDSLTYAGNLESLETVVSLPNYNFEKVDIRDYDSLASVFEKYDIDGLIHLAAESHVDRSITGPADFIHTNIIGTFNLLELARQKHDKGIAFRFHHVSTDEVFGSLGDTGMFTEQTPYKPNSPYSASKASADHIVRAYHKTYGINVVTTNCSNNYGPYQFPEKLIPLMINNAISRKPLPVYGDGKQIRDWLYVTDHCEALDLVFHKGKAGETYNIGGHNEIMNIDIVKKLCSIMDDLIGGEKHENLITFVKDRPGHDRRYAIDAGFIEKELGWKPGYNFDDGLKKTVQWYLENEKWLQNCISGDYQKYYEMMYSNR